MECNECQEKTPLNNLANHKETVCSYRVAICDHCSQDIPHCQMQVTLYECHMYYIKKMNNLEVYVSNAKGREILIIDVYVDLFTQSHLDHDCTEYPLNCPNGCENVTLPRNEVKML